MRKVLIALIVLLSVGLAGCEQTNKISITVPFGAPQFAQIYMQQSDKYDVTTVNGADGLVAGFGSKTSDVIFAPTNLGANIYNNGSNEYIMLASVVWGNLYFASQSEITGINDLNNKEVVLYGNNQIPGFVASYILNSFNVDATISYLASTADTAASLALDANKSKVYLVAKAQVSMLENNANIKIYKLDIQKLFEEKTGSENFPQASVFVKSSLSDDIKKDILTDLESSINKLETNLDEAANLAITLGIGSQTTDVSVMKNAIIGSNVSFKNASDAKPLVESFFNLLLATNPKLIGGKLPDNDFYYIN